MSRSFFPFRYPAYLCVGVSLGLIAIVLRLWGAVEVRTGSDDIGGLIFGGGVWLFVAIITFAWLGLDLRDDVIERSNLAALIAFGGAIVSVAITYAAGQCGEGPDLSENFFSAALGSGTLLGLWFLLEYGANVSRSVAEERDLASGIRLCGFLLAAGLILARASAGDWHSAAAAVSDFLHDGWPAEAILAIAVIVERSVRPSRSRPFPSWRWCGLLPAGIYVSLATAWLWHLGRWEGMP